MPIYAYRCAACGHTKDVLRKMSDPPLADCPACGAPSFEKQVTAAGFQLKGSGWYVTDFRNPAATPTAAKPAADTAGEGAKSAKNGTDASASSAAGGTVAPASTPAPAPAGAPAPAATPAPAPSPSGNAA